MHLDWRRYVVIDPQFYRPAEVYVLLARPTKARQQLSWQPEVTFEQLVALMVDADVAAFTKSLQNEPRLREASKRAA